MTEDSTYTVEQLEELMEAILWGYRIVEVDGKTFAFRPLSLQEKNIASFVREQALNKALETGRLAKEDLLKQAIASRAWSEINEEHIDALQEELSRRQEELSTTKQKSKKKTVGRRISKIEEMLSKLLTLRFNLVDVPSAEFYAMRRQLEYLVQTATCDFPDLTPKWNSFEEMENESDTTLVVLLVNEYTMHSSIDEKAIRRLARHWGWRMRWLAAKDTGLESLFRSGLDSLTPEQGLLMNWSMVYDSVYDSYDRPPEHIIEDDTELDRWLKKRGEEAEKERKKEFYQKGRSKTGASKSTHDANEILMPVGGYYSEECNCGAKDKRGRAHDKSCPYGVFISYEGNKDRMNEEIEKVQSTNPDNVRLVLAKEQKAIEGMGWVPEQELRTELSRKTLGMNTNIHRRDK